MSDSEEWIAQVFSLRGGDPEYDYEPLKTGYESEIREWLTETSFNVEDLLVRVFAEEFRVIPAREFLDEKAE